MDEQLENFVSLLNQHRQPRPVSKELAHLPDWAKQALSKLPEPGSRGTTAREAEPKPRPEAERTPQPEKPPTPANGVRVAVNLPPPPAPLPRVAPDLGEPELAHDVSVEAETGEEPKFVVPDLPPVAAAEETEAVAALTDLAEVKPALPAIISEPKAGRGRRPLTYALAAALAVLAIAGGGGYWYTQRSGGTLLSLGTKSTDGLPPADQVLADTAPPADTAVPNGVSEGGDMPVAAAIPAVKKHKSAEPTPTAPSVAVGQPEKPGTNLATPIGEAPVMTKVAPETAKPPKSAVKLDMAAAPAATPKPPATAMKEVPAKPALAEVVAAAPTVSKLTPATPKPPPAPAAPNLAAKATPKPAIAPHPATAPEPTVANALPPLAKPVPMKPTAAAPVVADAEAKPAAKEPGETKLPSAPSTAAKKPPAAAENTQIAMVMPPSATITAIPAPTSHEGTAQIEPTWQRNAVPAPPYIGEPRIAVVIDDLGLDKRRTARAIALKGPVTLSFLAYASDLKRQTAAARAAGHELIVHVPMEPIIRPKYLGEKASASSTNLAQAEILRRLKWDLSRFTGYVGVNNHMGSRLSSDPNTLRTVMRVLKARGLLFLDSRTAGSGATFEAAQRFGVPTATRDIFLDDDVSTPAIQARLAALEKMARDRGTAIAVGHPHDRTLDALTVWLASLPSKGFQLVPLTAIVKQRDEHLAGVD